MVTTSPAKRLNLKHFDYHSSIRSFQKLDNPKGGTYVPKPRNLAHLLMSWAEMTAKWSYLAGDHETFAKWSRIAAEGVLHYLLGDWKYKEKHDDGTISPDRWFRAEPSSQNMTWVVYFADGLCYGAAGGHWDIVEQLLTFPEPTIQADSDGKIARDYYLGLAAWWKDPQNVAWIKEVKELRGAGSKAYHLLCDAVGAIAAGDKLAIEKALDQYVKLFIKRRDHEEQFPIAATFLWHVARCKGVNPELPEETERYIFVPLEEL